MEVSISESSPKTTSNKRYVFDCADCGRHIEQNDPLSRRMKLGIPRRIDGVTITWGAPLCAACTYCPDWYHDPIFRMVLDPEYFPSDS